MIDKRVKSLEVALDGFGDGSSVLVNGFGGAGVPFTLIKAIENTSAKNLTLILNSIRFVDGFAPQIFAERRVSKVICTAARVGAPVGACNSSDGVTRSSASMISTVRSSCPMFAAAREF